MAFPRPPKDQLVELPLQVYALHRPFQVSLVYTASQFDIDEREVFIYCRSTHPSMAMKLARYLWLTQVKATKYNPQAEYPKIEDRHDVVAMDPSDYIAEWQRVRRLTYHFYTGDVRHPQIFVGYPDKEVIA